jgi:transcription elongation factor Elf1
MNRLEAETSGFRFKPSHFQLPTSNFQLPTSNFQLPISIMITKELLYAIRNDLPMRLTIHRLGDFGPIAKQSDGYFRFQCPHCGELRATVNPTNNLAHCFSCGKNCNNIDLMIMQGHDFLPAVKILSNWLEQYQRDSGRRNLSNATATSIQSTTSIPPPSSASSTSS